MVLTVRSVMFGDDGSVIVEYLDVASDVKANGLVRQHAIQVPDLPDYADNVDAIASLARVLVRDVLEDWPQLESVEVDAEDHDGPGPYDNPNER